LLQTFAEIARRVGGLNAVLVHVKLQRRSTVRSIKLLYNLAASRAGSQNPCSECAKRSRKQLPLITIQVSPGNGPVFDPVSGGYVLVNDSNLPEQGEKKACV